jgi:hypothetical protein
MVGGIPVEIFRSEFITPGKEKYTERVSEVLRNTSVNP